MGSVVDGPCDNAVWQGPSNFVELCCNALCHRAAVLANQQHGRPEHDLLSVMGSSTGPQVLPFPDVGHVGDANRNAVARADDDVLDFVDIGDLAGRSHKILLAVAFDIARTDVGVVSSKCRHHLAEAQLVGHQLRRVRQHVKLLFKSSDGVDLNDAGNVPQLRLDDPVLDRA